MGSITVVISRQSFDRGETAVLNCSANGGPNNMFQWQRNGSVLEDENTTTLTIANLTASQGGVYTCNVSNSAGSGNSDVSLNIRPYFTTQPMNMTNSNGSMISLTCVAEAFPFPEYQWGRGDGGEIRNDITGQNSTMLTFTSLVFGDEGDYYCNVTSGNSRVRSGVITINSESYIVITSTYKTIAEY